ncbi:MAG: alkaline phosphatase D family protein [Stagnimonas sp.]|nr:alkaline phosphatase D family protein [Stagnimonas sp.]
MSGPRRIRNRLRLRRPSGLSRRAFLGRLGSLAGLALAAPVLSSCVDSTLGDSTAGTAGPTPPPPPPPAKDSPFQHGVASGDPVANAVILWTRATPVASEDIAVTVKVYHDPALSQLVGSASQVASSARDWTIKIDFTELAPASTYYYQFEALGHKSVIGRTKTAPAAGAATARLRVGVVSCSSYAHGYFNAYRMLAKRSDLDVILHLGDYIYEYANGEYGSVRTYEPATEMITLADYRARHNYYKRTDADLRELHRHTAFITVWDDHETCDNSYTSGAVNHTEGAEGSWQERKGFGQRVYDEWMPIRLPTAGDTNKIWRRLGYGDLAEFVMLDTRLYDRDEPTAVTDPTANTVAADPTRTLLGDEQRAFLEDRLLNAPVKWKIVGQQVMVSQFKVVPGPDASGTSVYFNYDQWDGYQADRTRLFDFMAGNDIANVVVLTGDIHSSWAHELTPDPNNPLVYTPGIPGATESTGSLGVEYVVPSITSPGFEQIPSFPTSDDAVLVPNPQLKYFDGTQRGYCLLDITPARLQCEWYYVPQITSAAEGEAFGAAWGCDDGSKRQSEGAATAPIATAPPLAP